MALVASFASMGGLLVAFLPSPRNLPSWAVALLVSATLFLVLLVVLEFLDRRGRRVYAKSDAEGIKRYMHGWIEHGGRVAIWTRDISWAQNPETRRLLTEKARRNELILCLPELNELAGELARAGAEVCAYGARLLESPASRFTIAFFGRDGSRVAVGRAEGETHVIDEFSAGGHPAFHLAADLITLVRALQQRQTR
ncbi:MAG TPA: hypothetical protein VKG64_07820 [Methylomirabilota bacterium]|nr:hypothetical protein [Methylomirabilota bacterium]